MWGISTLVEGFLKHVLDVTIDIVQAQESMGRCSWAFWPIFNWIFLLYVFTLALVPYCFAAWIWRDGLRRMGEERLMREFIKIDLDGGDVVEAWRQKCEWMGIRPDEPGFDRNLTVKDWARFYG